MTDSEQKTNSGAYGQHLGLVKWFNNKRGYGFVKVVSQDRNDEDIFVHQTNIHPITSEYRALYKGEYVSFNISDVEGQQSQAVDVTGVCGGTLSCDNPRPQPSYGRGRGGGRGGRGSHTSRNDESGESNDQ